MQIIKYCMLFLVFILSNVIGNYIAKGYMLRLEELEEIKNALNIFKTKTLSQLCERVFVILFLMGVCLKIKNRAFFKFNSNFLSNFNFFYIFINFHL